MEALKHLIPLAFTVSLSALVLRVGLDADDGDLVCLFRQPMRLLRAVLAVNVIVPIVAVIVVSLVPISHVAKAGILLMAISPVPPLVPGKELKVGGTQSYAYGLYTALILLAVIIVPVSVAIYDAIYPARIAIPPMAVAQNVAVTVLAPLLLGVVIRRLFPGFAETAAPLIGKAAMILLLVAFIPMLIAVWPAIAALVGDGAAVTMAVVIAIALATGHLLGGPGREDRAALAVTTATRHPGIAMLIAGANTDDRGVTAAILFFLLVGLVVAIPYQAWLGRQHTARPA